MGGAVTRQSWTALVAAVCFVLLALALALFQLPFVAWAPGRTVDVLGKGTDDTAAIAITGLQTYPPTGKLLMTTVSVTRADSHLSLPEGLFAYWMPNRDVLPRGYIYPAGKSPEEVRAEEVRMMDTSQRDAVVAALRAAGQPVTELPVVQSVVLSGPAFDKLQPGDLLQSIDGEAVQTPQDVERIVTGRSVGDEVKFAVLRAGSPVEVTITTVSSNDDTKVPRVGVGFSVGYKYSAKVTYGIDQKIVGPSAGLMFSLGIYDMITKGDLVAGRTIAGSGEIHTDGSIASIGGIQEKIAGALRDGAKAYLVPAGNCADTEGMNTSMPLVKVSNLKDAIAALDLLKQPSGATKVPTC